MDTHTQEEQEQEEEQDKEQEQVNIDFEWFWNDYDKKVGDKQKLKKKEQNSLLSIKCQVEQAVGMCQRTYCSHYQHHQKVNYEKRPSGRFFVRKIYKI